MVATNTPSSDFTISFVMPNCNHGRHIGEAIDAVLTQTERPLELIVIDDASTDNSVEVVEQFMRKDSIVRLIRNERNMGPVYTLDRGMKEAKGAFIYGGGSDDKVLPRFVERSMGILRRYPHAVMCVSNPATLHDATGVVEEHPLYWADEPCFIPPGELAKLIQGGYVHGIGTITKRSVFEDVGGYTYPELRWHSDWFLWQVLSMRHGICYIPECLGAQRVIAQSYSASGRRDPAVQRGVIRYILSLLKSPQFRDVLPRFAEGSLMSHFGNEIVDAVMEDPTLWDVETLLLIQEPLFSWNLEMRQRKEGAKRRASEEQNIRSALVKAHAMVDEGKAPDAFSMLFGLLKQYPHLLSGYLGMAELSAKLGNLSTSIEVLTAARKVLPKNTALLNRLGNYFAAMGDSARAAELYKEVLTLDAANYAAQEGLESLK